ncbi:hypothetical protein FRC18_010018 [Serendipita sp. 400]|nr:hypothetical protein FRC18_010018 [Serendipita sp. 400]
MDKILPTNQRSEEVIVTTTPTVLKIFCLLLGQDVPFHVIINGNEFVADLKKAIHKEIKSLSSIDPHLLALYVLDLPEDDDLREKAAQRTFDPTKALKATMLLYEMFPGHFEKTNVHLLVVPPGLAVRKELYPSNSNPGNILNAKQESKTLSNLPSSPTLKFKHTPLMNCNEVQYTIEEYLLQVKPRFKDIINGVNGPTLPLWKSQKLESPLKEHVAQLDIPITRKGLPSLLLHHLGEADIDQSLQSPFSRIFNPFSHKLLIDTSGAGKTRILLEGLSRYWGFYFVTECDNDRIGSPDLLNAMNDLDHARDYELAKQQRQDESIGTYALDHMSRTVERRLLQLLLARFILLNCFLQLVPENGKRNNYSRLWMFLQVQPTIYQDDTMRSDIFEEITLRLRSVDIPDLRGWIQDLYIEIRPRIGTIYNPGTEREDVQPIFCILDQIQGTVHRRLGEFISGDGKTERPILRPMLRVWSSVLDLAKMQVIISGRGIQVSAIMRALSSSALKPSEFSETLTVGAFGEQFIQSKYIQSYLAVDRKLPQWKEFLNRAWRWCRGRYRFTASLITMTLDLGAKSPHKILEAYVRTIATFVPTDQIQWSRREPKIRSNLAFKNYVSPFEFEKLTPKQRRTLATVIYGQILYQEYELPAFASEDAVAFLEYGIARHDPESGKLSLDEPLAVLAAFNWINKLTNLTFFESLVDDLGKHSTRRNGFEAYLAFYIWEIFKNGPRLDEVFTFRGDFVPQEEKDVWQAKDFELVSVWRGEDGKQHVSLVTPMCGPSFHIGYMPKKNEEVLDWITNNPGQSTFCFPKEFFGPDIMFFLRSKATRKLLLVLMQATYRKDNVTAAAIKSGVRSVTPSWLWKRKGEGSDPKTAHFNKGCKKLGDKTNAALENICGGIKIADCAFPVLRVMATWPASLDLDRTLTGGQRDTDRHPLATLNLKKFENTGKKIASDLT